MKDIEKFEKSEIDSTKKDVIADKTQEEVARELAKDKLQPWMDSVRGSWRFMDSEYGYGSSAWDIAWAVLIDYSYYPGWGCWMEYWVKIFVKRGEKTDMKRIVYRDSHDAYRDDWSKAFKHIDKVEVMDDRVVVTVSSSSRTSDYTFFISKPKEIIEEKWLSPEEQEKFREHVAQEKERLLEQETREHGMMPSIYDFGSREIPGSQVYDKKYDPAVIIDEYLDVMKWECYIVIKTQIDASMDSGKQFAWLKYKITPDSTKLVERDQAYQSELKDWKRIDMQAMW